MNLLKAIIFYPMLFMRVPLIFISNTLIGLLFFGTLMMMWIGSDPEHGVSWSIRIMTITGMFCLCLLRYFYESILIKINPHNT
jgi:hypothetical protein